ncbi:hypothetical protein DVH24_023321 [Malus domestica]|uniref:Uncharacterized protein n=1 Tax=Malus domestica TaxID=3750 RepID=A0A498KLX7_MALDO|nr:hypothetical protein DVH24_023321 [Malus domestica]
MITIYSCSRKVTEAEATLNEMLETSFEPSIFILISLIQCYGKANHTNDVVRIINQLLELSITTDERLCGCLPNVMTQTPKEKLCKLAKSWLKSRSLAELVSEDLNEAFDANYELLCFKCIRRRHRVQWYVSWILTKVLAYCWCKDPTTMTQLQPISMCNIIYKIVSKVLTNKLKLVLPQLISPSQSSFILGRLILDNTLVASEIAHYMYKKKCCWC